MSQKVNPISYRLGITKTWNSKWFSNKGKYRKYLLEDIKLRNYVNEKLKNAGVASCEIERGPQILKLNIYSSRPGIIIGRAGSGIEELKKEVEKFLNKNTKVEVNITEIKNPEENALLMAQMIAEQIEKRISYRRVIKRLIDRASQSRDVKGIKIMVSGRLDGSEIAREEWEAYGKIPLQTLRADVDFATYKAHTTYGVIGIKVWIYKGEVFEGDDKKKSSEASEEEKLK